MVRRLGQHFATQSFDDGYAQRQRREGRGQAQARGACADNHDIKGLRLGIHGGTPGDDRI
jgi:hypothetical protein